MFALLAVIAFVVALVKLGTFSGWEPWLVIGLLAMALSMILDAYILPRLTHRGPPPP